MSLVKQARKTCGVLLSLLALQLSLSALSAGKGRLLFSIPSSFAADCNADGIADLSQTQPLELSAPHVFDLGSSPEGIAVADIDGDSHLDIVAANSLSVSSFGLSFLRGYGDGTFATQTFIGGRILATDVAVGDLDGDGKLDLAVAETSKEIGGGALGDLLLLANRGAVSSSSSRSCR